MIVTGIADMRRYCPAILIREDRDTFTDAIAVAEDLIMTEILGTDLYNKLGGETEDSPLRVKAQRAIALEAFATKISSVDVVLHDTGFGVENSESFQAASRTRIEALKENTRRDRDAAVDTLVRFLMETVEHDDWRSTPQYDMLNAGLVNTLREVREFAILTPEATPRMPQDWEGFRDFRPKMTDALWGLIAARTGNGFVQAMQDGVRARTLTPQQKQALFLMKWVVVNAALGNTGQAEFYLARLLALLANDAAAFPEYERPTAKEKENRAVMNFLT